MSQRNTVPKHNTIEIYDHNKMIEQTFSLFHRDLSQEHYTLAKKYDVAMVKDTLGKATRLKQLKTLLSLGRLLGKDWSVCTKDDVDYLVVKIMDQYSKSGKETETTRDHKKVLKLFFRWYKLGSRNFRKVGDTPETRDITVKRPTDKLVRENLLDEKDLANLLKACGENARDRAFLHVHYEANTRPGEILSLQIKHVTHDAHGAKIAVDGKTGTRSIRLIESVPSLNSWLSVHPLQDNPDAPLWISFDKNRYGESISLKGAQVMLAKRCRMAQISKRVNLKLFRHSGATNIAHFLSDELMKKRMGWTKTSTMPARYTHLNNEDVEKAFFREYGISGFENNKIAKVPKICNICDTSNIPDAKSCSKCGKPLHLHAIIEQENKQQQERELMGDKIQELENKLNFMQKYHTSVMKQFPETLMEYAESEVQKVRQEYEQIIKKLTEKS